jgi:hypothetical protein
MERKPLTCPACRSPWWISHILSGGIAVRPDSWFSPVIEVWQATCQCETPDGELRVIRRPTEAELYRDLGTGYGRAEDLPKESRPLRVRGEKSRRRGR